MKQAVMRNGRREPDIKSKVEVHRLEDQDLDSSAIDIVAVLSIEFEQFE
jgi:hypothetical protein